MGEDIEFERRLLATVRWAVATNLARPQASESVYLELKDQTERPGPCIFDGGYKVERGAPNRVIIYNIILKCGCNIGGNLV